MSEFSSSVMSVNVENFLEIFYGPHQEAVKVRLGDIDAGHRQACVDLLTENGFKQKEGYADPTKSSDTLIKDLVGQLAINFPICEQSAGISRYLIGPHDDNAFGIGIWERSQAAA